MELKMMILRLTFFFSFFACKVFEVMLFSQIYDSKRLDVRLCYRRCLLLIATYLYGGKSEEDISSLG